MTRILASLASGLLFGTGLVLSGMTRPAKVVGFLDVTGAWDPSLALVMGGALMVYALVRRVVVSRTAPVCATSFQEPTRRDLDGRLLAGAALFGVGWGIAGYCPGPALVAIVPGGAAAWTFLASMLAGMWVFKVAQHRLTAATATGAPSTAKAA